MKQLITEQDISKLKRLDDSEKIDFIDKFSWGAKKQVLKLIARKEKLEKILEILNAYELKVNAAEGKEKARIYKEIDHFSKMLQKYKRA